MKFIPQRTEKKRAHWCGPYVLALISGQSYDNAYKRAIRSLNYGVHKRYKINRILGMHNFELLKVAKTFRTPLLRQKIPFNKTFYAIMNELRPRQVYVLEITGHYVVVDTHDWTISDNHFKWDSVHEYKRKKTKVQSVWVVRNPKF